MVFSSWCPLCLCGEHQSSSFQCEAQLGNTDRLRNVAPNGPSPRWTVIPDPEVPAFEQAFGNQLVVVDIGLLGTEFCIKVPAYTIDVNIGCTRMFMTSEGRNRLVIGVCFA